MTNKEEEETAMTPVTEGSAVLLSTRIRTESDLGGSIDLLAALQLHNTTRQGVSQVQGLTRLKPAYYLQGESQPCPTFSARSLFIRDIFQDR